MTCIQEKRGGSECFCVLQLTEAGDVFYQILKPEQPDASSRPRPEEDEPLLPQAARNPLQTPDSELVAVDTDTSSNSDIIGPTQMSVAETPERVQQAVTMFSESSSEDSECERRRKLKTFLQVVVNDGPDGLDADRTGVTEGGGKAGDFKIPDAVQQTASGSGCLDDAGASQQHCPVKISQHALITWKHWLQKLMQKSPRPHCSQHFSVSAKGLLHLPAGEARDSTEEERVQNLRRDLRACMSKRSLLVHGAVSDSLGAPDVVPVPEQVDTEVWRDQLSQRLTLSWQGEEVWRAWWEDQLGLNRKEKVEALKRKRRREKEARRATGQRLELSGSFTSSISYQSELDDFSDSTGWSSAASPGMHSDTEGTGPLSQLEGFLLHGAPTATIPSTVQNEAPDLSPSTTPQSVKTEQGGQTTPSISCTLSLSQTVKHDSTPASRKKSRRSTDDYLNSLFATQVRSRRLIRKQQSAQTMELLLKHNIDLSSRHVPRCYKMSHGNEERED